MRIAIDARAFSWAGIGRYTRNLLLGLARQPSSHQFIVLLNEKDWPFFTAFQAESLSDKFSSHIVEGSYYSWQEQTKLLWQLRQVPADLFHFTHFNVPLLFSRPYVVTIHDVTRFIFPGQKRQDLWQQVAYELVFKRALERAQSLICVSATTRNDLRQLPLSLPRDVQIIPEGVDDQFNRPVTVALRHKVRIMLDTTDPYLLYVGVWMSHKNLLRLLEAFALTLKRHPHLRLVMTGKPKPGYSNILHATRKLKIEHNVIFTGFVPPALLPALYAEATCFIFPSLYEGFGLPPLEAAACGVPVITSNVSSLPEVMAKAAYYVNPEYVPDIAQGIAAVLRDSLLRNQLIAAGHARVRQFSWTKAAAEHLTLYEQSMSVL
ncbi:MAG: glycosyltransferase family 1 protein [Candidatus Andersenbacteria bacterium]